ncbi:hypothetical protein RSSE_p1496 (plasmid) [Ralstonia solanacearum]|nr:hypothetical protein RSSE_p1496 [Ralstonia solanacearum]
MITVIGLSAKNAILIVEFAKQLREQGKGLVESAVTAARLRLRPILMTSLAFGLGVVPLMIAMGASAETQHAIGTGVFGGMVSATVLAIFFVPVFFVFVMGLPGTLRGVAGIPPGTAPPVPHQPQEADSMRLRILPLVLALSACSLTPALIKPALPVPATFPAESGPETQAHVADLGWRTMFGDRRLQRLIGLALANNRDLRLAALNVETVRAQYSIQARRAGCPASTPRAAPRASAPPRMTAPVLPVLAANSEQYGVNVGAERIRIDLFGRVRSLSDAAFARYWRATKGAGPRRSRWSARWPTPTLPSGWRRSNGNWPSIPWPIGGNRSTWRAG